MGKLGNYDIFIISETETTNNQVTSKPIENSVEISDNIIFNPKTFDITINISKNSSESWEELQKLRKSKVPLTYEGVDFIEENLVITSMNKTRNVDIKDGFQASISLQQIQTTEQSQVTIIELGNDPFTGEQVQADNNTIEKRTLEIDNSVDESLFNGIEGVL